MICFPFLRGLYLINSKRRLFKDDFLKRKAKYIHIYFKNKFKKNLNNLIDMLHENWQSSKNFLGKGLSTNFSNRLKS